MAQKGKQRAAPTKSGVGTKFIKERHIFFGEIKDTIFARLITQYGWRKYVDELLEGNLKLVQDFYNNFNGEIDNEESARHRSTKVLGKWITVLKEVIDEYLGLNTSNAIYYAKFAPDFSGEDVVKFLLGRSTVGESGPFHNGDLGEMAWYMHHFVANNVEPTSSTTTISILTVHNLES